MTEIVLTSTIRTAVGTFGGALKDVPAVDLATLVAKEAISRAGISPTDVEHVVYGNVMHTAPEDPYLPRVAMVKAGVPVTTPAYAVNRLCGSGIEALCTASRILMAGEADVALVGGTESMSRAPYWLRNARWGLRMGDDKLLDSVLAGLTDPFHHIHMGVTGENVAAKYNITRERQDEWGLISQQRAAAAIQNGHFADQIIPVEIPGRRGEVTRFDTDEHPRATSAEKLAALKPAFKPDGTVTAGNAAGLNDGAAAMIAMTAEKAKALGSKPVAKVLGWAVVGCSPEIMGVGPIDAVKKVLKKTGLTLDQMDVIEFNEAFAAQVLAVMDTLGMDPAKTNPNGGAIALGHPIGATGAILITKLVHELHRSGGTYGLVTACIGGGQGIAAIFERV